MKKVEYLIIGNGIAGLSAAKEIRKNNKDANICMVSREERHTYYRVKLTELIAEDYDEDDVLVNDKDWYIENKVEVLLGKSVEDINTEDRFVLLEDGERIGFKKLLIATGSNPFIPPIKGHDKKGVFALRTLEDLENFKDYLKNYESVAVIGGGLLGLEAAWSLHKLGKEVNIVEQSEGVLGAQLDRELAVRLSEELQEKGLKIHSNVGTDEILGDGKVTGLKLNNGESIDVGAVLMSTGVRSDYTVVNGSDIKTDRGIKVNNRLETNIDDIYAAGDVAEIQGITLGLWTAALEMGRYAGENMTGGSKEYSIPKLFASFNVDDIKVFSAGDTKNAEKIYEYKEGYNHGKIFVTDGNIVGGILYGDTKLMNKLRPAVFDKVEFDKFLKDNNLEELYK